MPRLHAHEEPQEFPWQAVALQEAGTAVKGKWNPLGDSYLTGIGVQRVRILSNLPVVYGHKSCGVTCPLS